MDLKSGRIEIIWWKRMVTLPQKFIFKMLLFPRRSYCCCAHMDSQYQFPLRLITECCDMTPLAHLTKYKSLISYLWIGVTDLCGLSPLWKRLSVLNLQAMTFWPLGGGEKGVSPAILTLHADITIYSDTVNLIVLFWHNQPRQSGMF